ncbi:MAG: hypothetical protein GY700_11230 [Propionibacteriaceae bacterium]|nr:hypothetical protein [Propionibacteriaceae bacterium]
MKTTTYEPTIVERDPRLGGFLALSPESCPFGIGVIAGTVEEVRRQFDAAVQRWEQILATPEGA